MHVHVIEIMTKALHDFYALFSMHENKTANYALKEGMGHLYKINKLNII